MNLTIINRIPATAAVLNAAHNHVVAQTSAKIASPPIDGLEADTKVSVPNVAGWLLTILEDNGGFVAGPSLVLSSEHSVARHIANDLAFMMPCHVFTVTALNSADVEKQGYAVLQTQKAWKQSVEAVEKCLKSIKPSATERLKQAMSYYQILITLFESPNIRKDISAKLQIDRILPKLLNR